VDSNDAVLIRLAQRGDVGAFSAVVERKWVGLVRFARSVLGDVDAEDVVQESLVMAWEKLSSLREPAAFSAWVLRIVARGCIRSARSSTRMSSLASAPDRIDPGSARRTESFHVERILALLPPRQRAVMHLTVIEGMSDSEIGNALGITAASVRSHRRRARETLRSVLQGWELKGGSMS
jgi:RNA polymerase sigma-70 factor (ECF subfamily)